MADTAEVTNGAGLSTEELEFLRSRLLEEKATFLALYQKDVRSGQHSLEDGPEDIVDRANLAYNRELMFSLSDSERDRLRQIEDALERMNRGAYGVCEHSGKPIGLPRLRIIPWARYSAEYQEMIEKGLLDG